MTLDTSKKFEYNLLDIIKNMAELGKAYERGDKQGVRNNLTQLIGNLDQMHFYDRD